MKSTQMAIVPKKAFAFCRFTICILFWITAILLFFDIKWMIFVPFIIMLLSGILTVRRAPLIVLYKVLFDRKKISICYCVCCLHSLGKANTEKQVVTLQLVIKKKMCISNFHFPSCISHFQNFFIILRKYKLVFI